MGKKKGLTWIEYISLIDRLGDKIPHGYYRGIVGVGRGGLIPAVVFSHRFNLPLYPITPRQGLIFGGERILVVDDLVDTGSTLSICQGDVAVLFKKPWSIITPTYWVEETEDWVVFPYEMDETCRRLDFERRLQMTECNCKKVVGERCFHDQMTHEEINRTMLKALKEIVSCNADTWSGEARYLINIAQVAIDAAEGKEVGK